METASPSLSSLSSLLSSPDFVLRPVDEVCSMLGHYIAKGVEDGGTTKTYTKNAINELCFGYKGYEAMIHHINKWNDILPLPPKTFPSSSSSSTSPPSPSPPPSFSSLLHSSLHSFFLQNISSSHLDRLFQSFSSAPSWISTFTHEKEWREFWLSLGEGGGGERKPPGQRGEDGDGDVAMVDGYDESLHTMGNSDSNSKKFYQNSTFVDFMKKQIKMTKITTLNKNPNNSEKKSDNVGDGTEEKDGNSTNFSPSNSKSSVSSYQSHDFPTFSLFSSHLLPLLLSFHSSPSSRQELYHLAAENEIYYIIIQYIILQWKQMTMGMEKGGNDNRLGHPIIFSLLLCRLSMDISSFVSDNTNGKNHIIDTMLYNQYVIPSQVSTSSSSSSSSSSPYHEVLSVLSTRPYGSPSALSPLEIRKLFNAYFHEQFISPPTDNNNDDNNNNNNNVEWMNNIPPIDLLRSKNIIESLIYTVFPPPDFTSSFSSSSSSSSSSDDNVSSSSSSSSFHHSLVGHFNPHSSPSTMLAILPKRPFHYHHQGIYLLSLATTVMDERPYFSPLYHSHTHLFPSSNSSSSSFISSLPGKEAFLTVYLSLYRVYHLCHSKFHLDPNEIVPTLSTMYTITKSLTPLSFSSSSSSLSVPSPLISTCLSHHLCSLLLHDSFYEIPSSLSSIPSLIDFLSYISQCFPSLRTQIFTLLSTLLSSPLPFHSLSPLEMIDIRKEILRGMLPFIYYSQPVDFGRMAFETFRREIPRLDFSLIRKLIGDIVEIISYGTLSYPPLSLSALLLIPPSLLYQFLLTLLLEDCTKSLHSPYHESHIRIQAKVKEKERSDGMNLMVTGGKGNFNMKIKIDGMDITSLPSSQTVLSVPPSSKLVEFICLLLVNGKEVKSQMGAYSGLEAVIDAMMKMIMSC